MHIHTHVHIRVRKRLHVHVVLHVHGYSLALSLSLSLSPPLSLYSSSSSCASFCSTSASASSSSSSDFSSFRWIAHEALLFGRGAGGGVECKTTHETGLCHSWCKTKPTPLSESYKSVDEPEEGITMKMYSPCRICLPLSCDRYPKKTSRHTKSQLNYMRALYTFACCCFFFLSLSLSLCVFCSDSLLLPRWCLIPIYPPTCSELWIQSLIYTSIHFSVYLCNHL